MMNIDYSGKTVFLTGASRGIGKKIKESLTSVGAEVIAPERKDMDLSDKESIQTYFQRNMIEDCDIFIHCAGKNELAGIAEINNEILDSVFQVNMFAPIFILQHLLDGMKRKKGGKIVFVSSLYAIVSREKRIAYSASKNALTGLTKTLALELAQDNILVNAVAPGYVMTDMTKKNLSETEIAEIESKIPLGRFQNEEDIANLIAFICSDLNNNMTGQLIAVDGGFLCR